MATLRTGLTPEDRIENEVRKRMAERLSAAGVNRGRISLEVLYWLPADFVRVYMQVVEMALRMDDSLSSSAGSGVGDEGRATIAKVGGGPARGSGAGGLFTRSSGAHAKGGGGRYMRHWLVKDDDMMKLKSSIDRRIRRVIEDAIRDHREQLDARRRQAVIPPGTAIDEAVRMVIGAEGKGGGGVNLTGVMTQEQAKEQAERLLRTHGVDGQGREEGEGEGGEPMEKIHGDNLTGVGYRHKVDGKCEGCGKFLKAEWVICPHPHKEKG
jgi:hypothetical protein